MIHSRDDAMCAHGQCLKAPTCWRHGRSGLRAQPMQVFAQFTAGNLCEGYQPAPHTEFRL